MADLLSKVVHRLRDSVGTHDDQERAETYVEYSQRPYQDLRRRRYDNIAQLANRFTTDLSPDVQLLVSLPGCSQVVFKHVPEPGDSSALLRLHALKPASAEIWVERCGRRRRYSRLVVGSLSCAARRVDVAAGSAS